MRTKDDVVAGQPLAASELSRRRFLRFVGLSALSIPAMGLLQACGGSDENANPEPVGSESPGDELGGGSADNPTAGGTLRFALMNDPDNWTPHSVVGCANMVVMSQIWSSLLRYDGTSQLVGDLAEAWEWSDDTTLVFRLRENAKWHNGDPVTAEHVVKSMEKLQDPATSLRAEPLNQVIQGWEATDEHTVNLKLKQTDVTILRSLTTAPGQAFIVHPDFDPNTSGQSAETTIGTGPFKYESYEPGISVTLVKNPDYFLPELPYLDRIEMPIIEDSEARMTALRAGDVDVITDVEFMTLASLREDPNFEVPPGEGFYGCRLLLDHTRPPTDDRRIRQALNYAIDRERIAEIVLGGEATPIWGGVIPPGRFGHAPELAGYYSYDPEKAVELLAEAGWIDSGNGQLSKDGEPLHLTFMTYGPSWWSQVAEVFQANLRDIGVEVELEIMPWAEYSAKRQANMDLPSGTEGFANILGTTIWGLDLADEMQFHITGGWSNFTRFSNPELDEVFLEARATVDDAKREELFRQAQKLVLEEAKEITVAWISRAEVLSPKVKNFSHLDEEGCYGILIWEAYLSDA